MKTKIFSKNVNDVKINSLLNAFAETKFNKLTKNEMKQLKGGEGDDGEEKSDIELG
jgi:hypothetical protein